jgi:hypothetical protein
MLLPSTLDGILNRNVQLCNFFFRRQYNVLFIQLVVAALEYIGDVPIVSNKKTFPGEFFIFLVGLDCSMPP